MDCSEHKGHIRYVGGPRDGEVKHLTVAHPTDYPQTVGGVLRRGVRNWYELDYDASEGTEASYRFIGTSAEFPVRAVEG